DDGEGGEQYLTSAAVDPDDQALDDVYAVILGLRDRGMFDGAAIGRFLHGYTGWQQNFQTYENRAAQLERLFQREFPGQGPIQIQINRPQFTDNSLTGNPTPFTFTVRFRGATQTFPISGH
ncbi:MAG: hypothetical protein K2Z81_03840, partial [Cyanobacteria bacterium]|nr:hypothetical protein [Cyanobacteriota bacterium]